MSGELDHIMIQAFPTTADAFCLPPEPQYFFDLTQLPNPPEDWIFLDRRYERAFDERMLRASTARVMARLHFWGVCYTHRTVPTKKEIMKAIWKFYYYCPERNHPRTFKDLFDLERDHGPRLLGWHHHDPSVGPVSRFHPERPDPHDPASLGFQRLAEVPGNVTDAEAERYLIPSRRNLRYDERAQNIAFPTRPEFLGPGTDPRRVQPPQTLRHTNEAANYGDTSPGSRHVGMPGAIAPEPTIPVEDRVYTPRGVSPVIPFAQPEGDYREFIEYLEKTVLKYTYQHLERSPYAPSKSPLTTKAARSALDLDTVQIGTHSAHSHLRLNPMTLEFDPASTVLYPYRGRGPIWSGASCSVDCVIVLGMLLDIGCTNIDRESWRYTEISDLEKAYIEITNVNWNALTYDQNCAMRDLFRRKLCATVPSIKMGEPAPAWAIWSECTRNMAQFYFRYSCYFKSCACTDQSILDGEKYANCVAPIIDPADAEGVWLSELIERVLFNKTLTRCVHCGIKGDITETRLDELPPRLVVTNFAGHRVRVYNHTDDVRFRYLDSNGLERIATYRWLGGIYHKETHVRVYWTDQERGDTSRKDIRMYDDEMNSGAIFGGIPPTHETDRVPYDWTTNGFLMAVYERIINPPPIMLTKAAEVINTMVSTVNRGNAVLDNHKPWRNFHESLMEDPTRALLESVCERRVLPVAAEHVREAILSELPLSIIGEEDAFRMTDLRKLLKAWPPVDDEEMVDAMPEEYSNLFDSMLNSPAHLSGFPELWPNGSPRENGSLNFPNLPRSDAAKPGKPVMKKPTPMMDYIHWPSSPSKPETTEKPQIVRGLWGIPVGGVRGGLRSIFNNPSSDGKTPTASQPQSRDTSQRTTPATSLVQRKQSPSNKRPLEKEKTPSTSKTPHPKEPPQKKVKTEKKGQEAPVKKEVKKEKASSSLRDIPAKKSVKGKEPTRNSTRNQDKKKAGHSSSGNNKKKPPKHTAMNDAPDFSTAREILNYTYFMSHGYKFAPRLSPNRLQFPRRSPPKPRPQLPPVKPALRDPSVKRVLKHARFAEKLEMGPSSSMRKDT